MPANQSSEAQQVFLSQLLQRRSASVSMTPSNGGVCLSINSLFVDKYATYSEACNEIDRLANLEQVDI